MDTLQQRFDKLLPHVVVYGPDDTIPRPAFIMFHACGGVGSHLTLYAKFVASLGVRVYVMDSYTPRGWSRKFAATFVCIGLMFRGYERSGDVLAMLYGLGKRPEVDENQIILAGWSHGAWSVMDLMTQRLIKPGDAHLKDPDPKYVSGVKGLFLVYPIVNFIVRSHNKPWHFKPKILAVLTFKDHLASFNKSLKLIKRLRKQGVNADTLCLNATHAFDEQGIDRFGFMQYDQHAVDATFNALHHFVVETVEIPSKA